MKIIFLLFFFILFLKIFFLLLFKYKKGFNYYFKKKNSYKNSIFDFDHSIIFKQKKNFKYNTSSKVYYPIQGRVSVPILTSNNLGFFNGPTGNRNVEKSKLDLNKFIINCIGDSTTANYILDKNNYPITYPIVLEQELSTSEFKKNIEVNNFGQGMYGMQEILIKFIFENIYTNPNLIILYLGYNDIESYLIKDFSEDFSHSKKNLLQSKNIVKLSDYFYDFKINFLNYLLDKYTAYNLRYSIKKYIRKGEINLDENYEKGLNSFKKNIELIISICKANEIMIIPCTFCHYLYDEIIDDKMYKKFDEIIKKQNEIIREVCLSKKIDFIDMEKHIPLKREYFLDNIHFSEKGIRLFASITKKKIISIIK